MNDFNAYGHLLAWVSPVGKRYLIKPKRVTPLNELLVLVAFAHHAEQGGELLGIGDFYPSNAHFGFSVSRLLILDFKEIL